MAKILSFTFIVIMTFVSCEGETDRIGETVKAAELDISTIVLVADHADNLRVGRQVSFQAFVNTADGENISNDVLWASSDSSVLESKGGGVFEAVQNVDQEVTVSASFSVYESTSTVTVSDASLTALIISSESGVTEIPGCSTLQLRAEGQYEGESNRDETAFVDWQGDFASVLVGSGLLHNVEVKVESGVLDSVTASLNDLDGALVGSNSLNLTYTSTPDFSISSANNLTIIEMGKSITFSLAIDGISEQNLQDLSELVEFSSDALSTSEEPGFPAAGGVFSGSEFTAAYARSGEVVASSTTDDAWDDYGVNVMASCSGKLSNEFKLNIESDINQITLSPDTVQDIAINIPVEIFATPVFNEDAEDSEVNDDDFFWELEVTSGDQQAIADYLATIDETNEFITLEQDVSNSGVEVTFDVNVSYHGLSNSITGFKIPTN